jgi:hypothetical protein
MKIQLPVALISKYGKFAACTFIFAISLSPLVKVSTNPIRDMTQREARNPAFARLDCLDFVFCEGLIFLWRGVVLYAPDNHLLPPRTLLG